MLDKFNIQESALTEVEAVKKAEYYYHNKDYLKAIPLFSLLIETYYYDCFILKLGICYYKIYEFENAELSFSKYINIFPSDYRAYHYRALILMSSMKYYAATEYLNCAISYHPFNKIKDINNWKNIFLDILTRTRDTKINEISTIDDIRLKSYISYIDLRINRANIYLSNDKEKIAVNEFYEIATKLRPDYYPIYEKLFLVDKYKFEKSRYILDKYIFKLELFIKILPNNFIRNYSKKYLQSLLVTKGRIYLLLLDAGNAEVYFKKAVNVHHNVKGKVWLAYLMLWTQRHKESKKIYRNILMSKPKKLPAVLNLIRVNLEEGLNEKALEIYESNKDLLESSNNKDISHLVRRNLNYSLGNFEKAWLAFRDRKICYALERDHSIKYTNNICTQSLNNKKLVVLSEWGPGDELRWASTYADLHNIASNLHITCDPRLYTIFKRSFSGINFIPSHRRIRGIINKDNYYKYSKVSSVLLTQVLDNNSYEYCKDSDFVTLISDTLAITRNEKVSFTEHQGLLSIEKSYNIKMLEWLNSLPVSMINIGICWKSGLVDLSRSVHYSDLSYWNKIFEIPNVNFINLQYSDYIKDIRKIRSVNNVTVHTPPIDLKNDFESIAALISNLDIVISPATTVVELSGMLGTDSILFSNSPEIDWRVCDNEVDLWHSSIRHVRAERNNSYSEAQVSIIDKIYDIITKDYLHK